MATTSGFITLHRKIKEWEWYRHPTTGWLFVHLLLSVNYVDGQYKGDLIKRGQWVRSIPQLSTDTGLSIQTVKTALAHLKSTGEITVDTSRGYRVITVVKYDDYQKLTDKLTDVQPLPNRDINRQLTADHSIDQHLYNNNNNTNNDNKETINQGRGGSAKRFIPPTREQLEIFCLENGLSIDVDRFLNYYKGNGWMVGRNHMKDWEATARNWAKRDTEQKAVPSRPAAPAKRVIAQDYEQRDYSGADDDLMRRQSARIMERLRREGGGD